MATRDLTMGDLVYAERPLLMTVPGVSYSPSASNAQQMAFQQKEIDLKSALNRMDPDRRAAFLALANSHTEDGSGPLFGIVRTNSFGVRLKETGSSRELILSATCEVLSRVNHRCVVYPK